MPQYDLAVIGAGPGGYVAAICAARAGLKVALIEKEAAGGLCLNWGCIPSKILLKKAWVHRRAKEMLKAGEEEGALNPAFPQMVSASRTRVDQIRSGLEKLIVSSGVTLLTGTAHLSSPTALVLTHHDGSEERIDAKHILLATGSVPKTLPSLPIDGERIITSRDALALARLPQALVIVGGGVIGCEMATLFSSLGTSVTILEYMPQLLPGIDADISKALARAFARRGLKVVTSAKIVGCERMADGVSVTTDDGGTFEAEYALSAVGIAPATDGLTLDTLGVRTSPQGFVLVDPLRYRTTIPTISAIGDVIALPDRPHPGLAHVASCEGEIAAEAIAHGNASWAIDYDNIPFAIFTDPEIGTCGFTEEEAKRRFPDHDIVAQKTPERAMGVALALEETDGLDKLIVDQTAFGMILGAHILGPSATERIHVWVAARRAGESAHFMAQEVMAHPTFSEVFRESLLALDGKAVHVPLTNQAGKRKTA